ncbi:hypothetical protein K504DRAFT_498517 [Pleomassaria siparia CBS 279.74]|uniref:Uncharacterized protein n=1 Tax=Pleomassaria siparia CBS 279.74 TaxID=1314801 RepID=A0A6G1KMV3_9PLEO|nr:hypothetical protein K504DRAFT_498517 [Pleomassaria siparia CBS 279.74]
MEKMLQTIRSTLRKLFLTYLLITFLLHEPFIEALINILVTTHILLRIASDHIQLLAVKHSPTFMSWLLDDTGGLRARILAHYREFLVLMTPFIHYVLARMTVWGTAFANESPRWLCAFNEWLVKIGSWMVGSVTGLLGVYLKIEWQKAGDDVAQLCRMVRK